MNNLGLSFGDLYWLYRDAGMTRLDALRVAWAYRNYQPDHGDSRQLLADLIKARAEAAELYAKFLKENEPPSQAGDTDR